MGLNLSQPRRDSILCQFGHMGYMNAQVVLAVLKGALLKESHYYLTATNPASWGNTRKKNYDQLQPKTPASKDAYKQFFNVFIKRDSTDDRAVASYPAYPGSNTDDSLSCCSVPGQQ